VFGAGEGDGCGFHFQFSAMNMLKEKGPHPSCAKIAQSTFSTFGGEGTKTQKNGPPKRAVL
jgi:hypothetical protein